MSEKHDHTLNTQVPPPPLSSENLRTQIDDAIELRLLPYKKLAKGFCYGLSFIMVILVGSGLVTSRSLLLLVHDYVFGVENALEAALQNNLSVSYANSFWLGTHDDDPRQESITFFAEGARAVHVRFWIQHHSMGNDRPEVQMSLNGTHTLLPWTLETHVNDHLDLSELIDGEVNFRQRPRGAHEITFELRDEPSSQPPTRVYVRCLIAVVGRIEASDQ